MCSAATAKPIDNEHGASMSTAQRRVMTAIEVCRTAALGGHLERCDQCGHERNCLQLAAANRHCPKCQSSGPRANGSRTANAELLDVPVFPRVFTVPEEIAAIAYQNKEVVYGILFRATAETLTHHRRRPQASGRRDRLLRRAPHLGTEPAVIIRICIASCPAAACRPMASAGSPAGPDFFLPVRVLSRLFRRLFLESLQQAFDAGKLQFFSALEPLRDGTPSLSIWLPRESWNGWSMPSARSPDPAGARLRRPLHPPRRHLQ